MNKITFEGTVTDWDFMHYGEFVCWADYIQICKEYSPEHKYQIVNKCESVICTRWKISIKGEK